MYSCMYNTSNRCITVRICVLVTPIISSTPLTLVYAICSCPDITRTYTAFSFRAYTRLWPTLVWVTLPLFFTRIPQDFNYFNMPIPKQKDTYTHTHTNVLMILYHPLQKPIRNRKRYRRAQNTLFLCLFWGATHSFQLPINVWASFPKLQ